MAKARAKPIQAKPAPVEEPEAEEEVVEAPRVTTKDATDTCQEPKPGSKKDIVYQAGITKDGGSIKELAEQMDCTTSNVRQHIAQCHTKLGFGYTIEGDNFHILGKPTVTWEDQEADKAAKKPKKAAKEDTSEDGEDEDSGEEEDGDDFLE